MTLPNEATVEKDRQTAYLQHQASRAYFLPRLARSTYRAMLLFMIFRMKFVVVLGAGLFAAGLGGLRPASESTPSFLLVAKEDPGVIEQEALERIERALAVGNARDLLLATSGRVEVWTFGRGALYSRGQAQYVLQGFFEQHPPAGCTFRERSIAGGNLFATGAYYIQQREQPYKVYVHLRALSQGWELKEIRFE